MFNTLALWMCSAQKERFWLWHWHTYIHCVRITPKQVTVMLKRWIWCTAKLKIFFGNLKNLGQSVVSTSLDAYWTCQKNLKCFRYLQKWIPLFNSKVWFTESFLLIANISDRPDRTIKHSLPSIPKPLQNMKPNKKNVIWTAVHWTELRAPWLKSKMK